MNASLRDSCRASKLRMWVIRIDGHLQHLYFQSCTTFSKCSIWHCLAQTQTRCETSTDSDWALTFAFSFCSRMRLTFGGTLYYLLLHFFACSGIFSHLPALCVHSSVKAHVQPTPRWSETPAHTLSLGISPAWSELSCQETAQHSP